MTLVQRNGKYYTEYTVKSTDTGLMQIARDNPLPANHTWKEIIKAENDKWAPLDAANKWTVHPKQKLLLPADPPVSPPAPSGFDGELKVTASDGVNIRAKPDSKATILILDKNTKNQTYKYKKNSVTNGSNRVWVEVSLGGTSTGWLPVSGPSDINKPTTSPSEDWVTFVQSPATPPQNPVPVTSDPVLAALNTEYALGHLTRDQWLQKKKDLGFP